MLKLLIIGLYLFFGYSQISSAQLGTKIFKRSNNYFSIHAGLTYPFLSKGNLFTKGNSSETQYTILHSGINYGIRAGAGYAHFFSKKFSFKLSPAFMFTKISSTDYQYVFYKDGYLYEEHNGTFHYSHFSLLIPIDFNFEIKQNLDFAAGVFYLKPYRDCVTYRYDATLYYRHPVKTLYNLSDQNKNYNLYSRVGIHFLLSILMKERDWKQMRVNLEFYQSLSTNNIYYYENWIACSIEKVIFQ